jgi:hypothetical protein
MCSLFPGIKSIDAFSALLAGMSGPMARLVAAGLAASLFGTLPRSAFRPQRCSTRISMRGS